MADNFPLLIGAVLVNSFLLTQLLGQSPFVRPSGGIGNVSSVGIVTLSVLTPAAIATLLLDRLILAPYHLEYLRLITFMVTVAAFVQFASSVIRARHPQLLQALPVFLPLVATNCVILGAGWLTPDIRFDLFETVVYTLVASATATFFIAMFAALLARFDDAYIPQPFRGAPIMLISIGLISLACTGLKGVGG